MTIENFAVIFGDGVAEPTGHPDTGAPFVRIIEGGRKREFQTVRWGPPHPPEREYYEDIDDDGFGIGELRRLTDEEWARALASYERTMKEWRETGGVARIAGRLTIDGVFACADGSWAEGVFAGGEWYWTAAAWAP